MKQYILPISILGSFVLGVIVCKTFRTFTHPRINIKNIDWDKKIFEYSVNGGEYKKFEIGKSIAHGNINGKFDLSSSISPIIGSKEGYVLSVVDESNGTSSTAFINVTDKSIFYS